MGFCCILKVTKDFGMDPHPNPDPLVRERIQGSGSYPDPYQNVTDPQHC